MAITFIGKSEVKIFVLAVIGIIAGWLLFYPPAEWNHILWDYLNQTAPIYLIGQSAWILLAAFIFTFFAILIRGLWKS